MKNIKIIGTMTLMAGIMLFSGCNINTNVNEPAETEVVEENVELNEEDTNAQDEIVAEIDENHENHEDMEHDESGDLPAGITESASPIYPAGTRIVSSADHMPGMNGASGEVIGAFDTYAYEITYNSTIDGELVENHKWIVQEEIQDYQVEPYEVGDEIIINAKHMEGMEGATATIDSVEKTTVYMVDLELTDSDEMMRNHKWVTESEIEAE